MTSVADENLARLRAWRAAAESMALAGLKAEMDGLAAMFALWAAPAGLPVGLPPAPAHRSDFDNLPI